MQGEEEQRLVGFTELQRLVGGLSRATVWRYERAHNFPKHVRLGAKRVAWRLSEVREWIESRSSN